MDVVTPSRQARLHFRAHFLPVLLACAFAFVFVQAALSADRGVISTPPSQPQRPPPAQPKSSPTLPAQTPKTNAMPQKSPKIAEPIDLPCSIVKTFIGEMTIRYKFVVRNNTRQAIAPGKTIEWKLSGYKRQIAGQGFALVTLKEEGKYILSQPLGSSGSVVFKTADETRNGAFEKKYEKCIAVIPAVSDK